MTSETECAYPEGNSPPFDYCGAPTVNGSPYCPEHHRLCYLPLGSRRESAAVRSINRMAELAVRRRAPRPPGARYEAGSAPPEPAAAMM
jgi:hypothetical protein